MRRALLAALLALAGCGDDDGPYQAILLLEDEAGTPVEFALGGRSSYEACAELGAYEAAAYEGGVFWANPEMTYGGHRGGEDWAPYEVLGFSCRVPQAKA